MPHGGQALPAGPSREDAGLVDTAQNELQEKEEIWRSWDGMLNRKQESRGVFKAGLLPGARDVPRGISRTDLEMAGWNPMSVYVPYILLYAANIT